MPRRVRRASLALVALGVAALGGCGGGGADDAVRAYILDANAIQRDGSGDIAAANRAYARFSRGRPLGPVALEQLRTTAAELGETRRRLAELAAPENATALRGRLLAVFDRNIELADELALMAAYAPAAKRTMAVLPRANSALRRGLDGAPLAAGREQALRAYARRLGRLESRMRRLAPPKVLLAEHRSQLLKLTSARDLAGRLSDAVAQGDAAETARLLLAFRDVYVASRTDQAVQRAAVRAYRERVRDVSVATSRLRAEQARLQRSLG
jgi:hypothetical protein